LRFIYHGVEVSMHTLDLQLMVVEEGVSPVQYTLPRYPQKSICEKKENDMPMSDLPHPSNGYVIDAESPAETARLMKQDRLLTECMGGVFPEGVDLSTSTAILDLACGPGGWALDVAFAYPHIQVVGVDISRTTIEYAHARALTQGLDNATFKVMDVTRPLEFPDACFDLVNARLLVSVLSTEAWLPLLRECVRVTRPGGLIRLTECERSISTSPALEDLTALGALALKMAGHSFSPDGRTLGITPVLARLLREAGCQQIGRMAHVIDYSVGSSIHRGHVGQCPGGLAAGGAIPAQDGSDHPRNF
jgi:ubiquinone/menaquinone biosynthesis C-methylase UbiE